MFRRQRLGHGRAGGWSPAHAGRVGAAPGTGAAHILPGLHAQTAAARVSWHKGQLASTSRLPTLTVNWTVMPTLTHSKPLGRVYVTCGPRSVQTFGTSRALRRALHSDVLRPGPDARCWRLGLWASTFSKSRIVFLGPESLSQEGPAGVADGPADARSELREASAGTSVCGEAPCRGPRARDST